MNIDEDAYIVGQGKYDEKVDSDGLVRQAELQVKSCDSLKFDDVTFSNSKEICTIQKTGQTLGQGDSGRSSSFILEWEFFIISIIYQLI